MRLPADVVPTPFLDVAPERSKYPSRPAGPINSESRWGNHVLREACFSTGEDRRCGDRHHIWAPFPTDRSPVAPTMAQCPPASSSVNDFHVLAPMPVMRRPRNHRRKWLAIDSGLTEREPMIDSHVAIVSCVPSVRRRSEGSAKPNDGGLPSKYEPMASPNTPPRRQPAIRSFRFFGSVTDQKRP